MKTYRVMVTAYGFANVEANNEEEALALVNDMDVSDFGWDYDFSSEDAEIIEEWNEDEV